MEYLVQRISHQDNGCIVWTRGVDKDGYGQCHETRWGYELGVTRAHQMSYVITYGPIPNGLLVCHTCDNPSCINPKHLFLGTNDDNMKDMAKKGRARNKYYDPTKQKIKRTKSSTRGSKEDLSPFSTVNS